MANMRILVRNRLRRALSITAVPAMVSSSLSEANLFLPTERVKVARSSGLSTQDLRILLSTVYNFNMVAVCRHNWTTSSTLQRVLYGAGSPSTALSGGNPGAIAAYSTSGLDTDIEDYTESDFRGYKNTVQYFTQINSVGEVLLRYADAANPDGYLEVNSIWGGLYTELEQNPAHGALDMQFLDGSGASRADDGSHIVDKKWRARRLTIKLDFIEDTDLNTLLAISRVLGKDAECFLSVYPELGGVKELYYQGAFRLVDSPTFNPYQYGLHRNTMTFEET